MHISVPYQLAGPCEAPHAVSGRTPGDQFYWVGTALTAKTHTFPFNLPHAPLARAMWRVVWRPRSTLTTVRLVSFSDGPSNIVEMARITGSHATNPVNQAVDVTTSLNNLVNAGQFCNISFQIAGDNTNIWEIFECVLEASWLIS